jgi:hypothetical protein
MEALDIIPQLSVNTVHIVMKLMAKSKERRYQSGADLASACELVMSGKPARHAAHEFNESSIRVPLKSNKHGSAKSNGCFGVILVCTAVILIASCAFTIH